MCYRDTQVKSHHHRQRVALCSLMYMFQRCGSQDLEQNLSGWCSWLKAYLAFAKSLAHTKGQRKDSETLSFSWACSTQERRRAFSLQTPGNILNVLISPSRPQRPGGQGGTTVENRRGRRPSATTSSRPLLSTLQRLQKCLSSIPDGELGTRRESGVLSIYPDDTSFRKRQHGDLGRTGLIGLCVGMFLSCHPKKTKQKQNSYEEHRSYTFITLCQMHRFVFFGQFFYNSLVPLFLVCIIGHGLAHMWLKQTKLEKHKNPFKHRMNHCTIQMHDQSMR